MSVEPIVVAEGLVLSRAGSRSLDRVDFSLPEGRTTVVMGMAGSGKSSLLKTCAGLAVPDEGRVLWKGKDLAGMSRTENLAFRKRMGYCFQDAALWANQSLFDNIALPVRFHEPKLTRTQLQRTIDRAVGLVGYSGDLGARPATLSGGERRLIGLARALVLDPELLFLDDPSGGLDEESARRIHSILLQLRARRRTIMLVSANAAFTKGIADHVAVVREGRLAALGTQEEAAAWRDSRLRVESGWARPRGEGTGGEVQA